MPPAALAESVSGAGSVTGEVLEAVTSKALPGTHILKLSIATGLSDPLRSVTVHRSQKVAPGAMERPVSVVDLFAM